MMARSLELLYLLSPKHLPSQEVCGARIWELQNRTFIRKDRESHAYPVTVGWVDAAKGPWPWHGIGRLNCRGSQSLSRLHCQATVPAQNLILFRLQVTALGSDVRPCPFGSGSANVTSFCLVTASAKPLPSPAPAPPRQNTRTRHQN